MKTRPEKHDRWNSGRTDGVVLLAFTVLGFLFGWVIVEYLHNVYLQEYLSAIIHSSGSYLKVGLPSIALMGALAVFLRRRRNSRVRTTLEGGQLSPMTGTGPRVSHPLFLYDRPSRDSNFVVRKTRTPGRISRVREAERLPPGELA